MKKIVFNATILSDQPNGLSLYCKNILEMADNDLFDKVLLNNFYGSKLEHNEKNEVINIKNKSKLISIFLRTLHVRRYIKKIAKNNDILFYSPTQHGVSNKKISQIITIHDLIPLFYPKGRIHQYIYYKYILPKVIKNSLKVITVSENTKSDIIKYYKVDPEKVQVVYNGYDKPEYINVEESRRIVEEIYKINSYVLMVGINYSYKNLHSVIEAYSEVQNDVEYKLVIAGNNNVSYGRELINLTKKLCLEEKVIFLGYIDDEMKHKLYQASKAFIYSSLYEGFGLPILEAMSNQTPVVCSNTSSLPEVAGDAVIYMDSSDLGEIKNTLVKLNCMTEDERQELISKGNERVDLFSWEKCVQDVESILLKAIK